MAARLDKETSKLHIHLYTEDVEFIDQTFCREGIRTVGRSKTIRLIVHAYCQQLKRKAHAKSIPFDPSIAELLDRE
jgi:hypothetical protein